MKQYWIPMEEYRGFKIGDTVRRSDGGRDVEGKPWDHEGVITEMRHWYDNPESVQFFVAENGNLDRVHLLRPTQVKKIDKEFMISKNGKMKLF